MAYIDKLTNKFNKAKNAISSLKGISSKLKSIQYESVSDTLGEAKDSARELLSQRQNALEKTLKGDSGAKVYTNQNPEQLGRHLIYPMHDPLKNYITFDIMPRRQRKDGNFYQHFGEKTVKIKNATPNEFIPENLEFTQKHSVYKRNQISLYIPDTLISQSNVAYRNEGINQFNRSVANILSAFAEGGFGEAYDKGKGQVGALVTTFINQTMNKLSGGITNLRGGRAVNTQQEQLLDGMQFRTFDFTFDFYPKSQDEAIVVKNIIKTFRQSMLPDSYVANMLAGVQIGEESPESQNAAYFNYPNVFRIYFSGPMSRHVDGFLPCVCQNAQVDYTGGQKFSVMEDGMPNHIQLTLTFAEIKIMTLGNYERIRAGVSNDPQLGSIESIEGDSYFYSSAKTLSDVKARDLNSIKISDADNFTDIDGDNNG